MTEIARYPAFVVGSPRSGTSALVTGLRSAGYHGYPEGHLLSLVFRINEVVDRHFATFAGGEKKNLASAVDKELFKKRLCEVFARTATDLNPSPPWFDKTGNPQMILSIPMIRQLWPDSAFIFAKRRGIENVISRLKKFPGHSFEHHCQSWAQNMSAWRQVRTQLPPGAFIEVDQQDMIREPEMVAKRLCEFLRMTDKQMRDLSESLNSRRPQETEKGSSSRVHTLESSGMSQQQISVFLKHCQPEMDAFGYSLDEQYHMSR
jgi:hypothetical protein